MRRPRAGAALRLPKVWLGALPPRARLAAVAMSVTLAVIGGLYFFWLRDSSLVAVKHVSVSGVSGDNAHRIAARLEAAARGMTTLNVDEDALREAVAAFPEVRGVTADADLPHGLRIVVAERVPVGVLTSGREHVAVASDGTVLPKAGTGSAPVIPVNTLPTGSRLTDPATLRAIAILAAAPARLRGRIDELAKGKGGLRATLRGGGTIVIGAPTALAAKWLAAAAVLRNPGAKGAKYLDVRVPRRPVAGGLPPRIDPATGERIDPTSGEPVGESTDPLAEGSTDPTAGDGTDGTDATDNTSGDGSDATGDSAADPAADGANGQDVGVAGASP
ncbi:MAG: cell division protein FtsQ/DivIB [Solirubrobacteraceae bacterium]